MPQNAGDGGEKDEARDEKNKDVLSPGSLAARREVLLHVLDGLVEADGKENGDGEENEGGLHKHCKTPCTVCALTLRGPSSRG
mgnify:FL=1